MSIDEDQVSSATEILAEGLDYPEAAVAIVAFEKMHPGIDWVNEVRAAREAHRTPAMGTYDRIDEVTALLAETWKSSRS
jgi:hypothetical protein